jgi:hypothetical protein
MTRQAHVPERTGGYMLLYWSGRGWSVLLIMFGWMFVMAGIVIATHGPYGDPNANANVDRMVAIAFALSASCVFVLAHGRRLPPQTAEERAQQRRLHSHRDDFMFIPMTYYAYIFMAAAVWMLIKSFFDPG